jgi:hypothetical protein
MFYDWDGGTEQAFGRALALRPSYATRMVARVRRAGGRFKHIDLCRPHLPPRSFPAFITGTTLGDVLFHARHYAEGTSPSCARRQSSSELRSLREHLATHHRVRPVRRGVRDDREALRRPAETAFSAASAAFPRSQSERTGRAT